MAIRNSVATVGIAALAFGAAIVAPIAAAAPDLSPLVNTTCSYNQVVAALNVQAPDLASELSQYPPAQARLQKFLAAPVDVRQQMVQQALAAHPQWQDAAQEKAGTPKGQQAQSVLLAVAGTCGNY
jgi:hemophore-related protein